MPSCRNCGARLSKFDSDICPVCGTKKPLEGVNSETIEITSQVDLAAFAAGQKVVRRRKKMYLLSLLIGFTGALFYYIKKSLLGFIWLLINLLVMGGLIALFLLVVKLNIALAIILPILIVYAINALVGTIYFFKPNLKDGEGEFVV